MRTQYRAKLSALNEEWLGRSAHGYATLEVTDDDAIEIKLEMFQTPRQTAHIAVIAIPSGERQSVTDVNHDGVIDELEVEAASGCAFIPLSTNPAQFRIESGHYPTADRNGFYRYHQRVVLATLRQQFADTYPNTPFVLTDAIVYVGGVQADVLLPETAQSHLKADHPYESLPIASGLLVKKIG